MIKIHISVSKEEETTVEYYEDILSLEEYLKRVIADAIFEEHQLKDFKVEITTNA